MKRFPISWDKTLAALGFRRNVKQIKRDHYRRRNSRFEHLEVRAMLSGDVPALIQPEYAFVASEDYDPAEQFTLSTEYELESGTPRAILALRDDLTNQQIDTSLQEINLELRFGESVIETQAISFNIVDDSFKEKFVRDRYALVSGQVRIVGVEEAFQFLDDLNPEGVFASVGNGVDLLDVEVIEADWNWNDPLLESAERLSAIVQLWGEDEGIVSTPELKQSIYKGLDRIAQNMPSKEEASHRHEQIATALGRVALLIDDRLHEDIDAADVDLATAAEAARETLLSVVEPYYTIFGSYDANRDLIGSHLGGLASRSLTVVEEGIYEHGESLRVEVGNRETFVEATVTTTLFGASFFSSAVSSEDIGVAVQSQIYVSPLAGVQGGVVNEGNLYGSDKIFVGETNLPSNDDGRGLLQFDLSTQQNTLPTKLPEKAILELEVFGTTDTPVPVVSANADAWGVDPETAWYEPGYWAGGNLAGQTLDELFGNGDRSVELAASSNSLLHEFDVTEAVRRSLLLGDANVDGDIDHDLGAGAGVDRLRLAADVEAFYLAVNSWEKYVAEYSGADLLYRQGNRI